MTPPLRPIGAPPGTPEDPLSFLDEGPPQDDPLSFLNEGGEDQPEAEFNADGESEYESAADSIWANTPAVGEDEIPQGGVPTTGMDNIQGLRQLLEREDITDAQRTRINRLIHQGIAARAKGDQETPDPLWKQAALTAAQSALNIPHGIASTLGADKLAQGIEEVQQGIEPTIDPQGGNLQALTQAGGAAAGEFGASMLAFRPIAAGVRGTLGVAGRLLPGQAGTATKAVAELSARVMARTGSSQLANAVSAAPVELLAGTAFQGLTDPESLKTPQGVTMAFLFGTLGALGEGVRVTKVAAREARVTKAKEFVDKATNTAEETKVAAIEAEKAERAAARAAKSAARRAWDNATPEMRKVLAPEFEADAHQVKWNTLTNAQREAVVGKIRVAASDSKLNQSVNTGAPVEEAPAAPTPDLTDQLDAGLAKVGLGREPAPTPAPTSGAPPTSEPARAPAGPAPKPAQSEPAAGGPNPAENVLKRIRQGGTLTPEATARITAKYSELRSKYKGEALTQRTKDLVKAERAKIARAIPPSEVAPEGAPAAGGQGKPVEAPKGEAVVESGAAPVAPEAPKPSVDAEIARLQAELRATHERAGQAERRANAAERAANTDYTGVQSRNAFEAARVRLDTDPNTHMAMLDVKQFKPFNDTAGEAAGDEVLRQIGNLINGSLKPHEQAFRPGGDEFILTSTTEAEVKALADRIVAQFGERPIEGTPYTMGLRSGSGATYEAAGRALIEAKAAETGPKARVVERTPTPETIVPPSEAVPVPQVGEKPTKPVKPAKAEGPRTIRQIDKEINQIEKRLEKGEISDAIATAQLQALGREKMALKKAGAPSTVATVGRRPVAEPVTRRSLDQAAVEKLDIEGLRTQQTRLKMLMAQQRASPASLAELEHDMHLVQRELRMKKPVNELSDASLDTHAKELEARWQETPEAERAPIQSRLLEVDAEFKKRARPSIINVFKEERGSIYVNPDPLETNAGVIPAHSQRIQDRIEIDLEGDKPFPSMQDIFEKLHNMYSQTVRMTHAADVATERLGIDVEKAPAIKNPSKFAELILGANSLGRAQRMMKFGPFRWDAAGNLVESGLPGMEQILAPFKGRLNELRRYELARYSIELAAREKRTGIDLLDAVREEANVAPDVRDAADQLVKFRRSVLDYFTDSGMFSTEARAAMEKLTQAYVPLYRYFEGKGVAEAVALVGAKAEKYKATQGAGQVVKRLVGSVQKIVDPLRSTVDQTRRMITSADRNRLGTMLVEAAESDPEAAKGLIWKDSRVKTSIDESITKQAMLLKAGAKAHGVELPTQIAEEIALGLSDRRLRSRSDQLQVWRNGKREVWNISPELAAMYQGYAPHELHWAVKLAGFLPQTAKTLITDNPVFGLINVFRDTFDATLQSRYGFRIGASSFEGFLHSIRDTKFRQEFLAGAGTAGGISGRAISTPRTALEDILPRTAGEKIMYPIFHPLHALRQMTIPFEEASRLGEYVRARQSGAAVMDAALAAQRVTTNFQQRGLSMQGINHIVMFLNPGIQSLDTNIRAAWRNPARVALAGIGAITIPSIYLWAANRGDKGIEEVRKSKFGSSYWYFRTNSGAIGRMPKPFLFGTIFGTGMEDALDAWMTNDPTSADRFVESLVQQLPYNWLPNILNMTLGLKYNKDFSTGGPIAPDRLETGDGEVQPRFQARPETGPTARALGDVLNYSPAKIEFIVRNALGTLGQDALRGIDMANDAKDKYPAPVDTDKPLMGRFFARYPSAGAFSIRRFYDNARKHEVAINSLHYLEKTDPLRIPSFIAENKSQVALAELYADARKDLAEMRAASEAFAVLPPKAMSPEQKRKVISSIQEQMITIARTMNELVEKLEREEAAKAATAPSVSELKPSGSNTDILRRAAAH